MDELKKSQLPEVKLLLIFSLFTALFFISFTPFSSNDVWWHLKAGEYTFFTRKILLKEIWSFTSPSAPWVNHEWLAQFIFYSLFRISPLLLLFFKALVISLSFGLVGYLGYRRGAPLSVGAFLAFFASLGTTFSFKVRPQIFSFLFFSLFLLFLFKAKKDRKWLFPLPPLMVLWINLHGGGILGLALLGGEFFKKLWEREDLPFYGFILLLTFLASLFSPTHFKTLLLPFQVMKTSLFTGWLQELQSPDFHFLWIYEVLLLSLFLSFALEKRKRDPGEILLLFFFLHLSLYSVRYLPFFLLFALPLLGENLFFLLKRGRGERLFFPLLSWGVSFFLLLFSFFHLFNLFPLKGEKIIRRENYPLGAVGYIKQHGVLPNLFNHYDWGGWLVFSLYPYSRVFMDSRADVYGEKIFSQFLTIFFTRPGWRKLLKDYHINTILVPTREGISQVLKESREWKLLYQDKVSSLFIRVR